MIILMILFCLWMGRCMPVFFCICVSLCVISLRKSLITFGRICRPIQNFQNQSGSLQVIFGQGSQIGWPPGCSPRPKMVYFYKIYLLLEFSFHRDVTYIFETSVQGQNNLESIIDIWGRPEISGSEFTGTRGKFCPDIRHFYIKWTPAPTINS
jgi:hypothetical protein